VEADAPAALVWWSYIFIQLNAETFFESVLGVEADAGAALADWAKFLFTKMLSHFFILFTAGRLMQVQHKSDLANFN